MSGRISQVSPRALRASALRRIWSPGTRFSMPGNVAVQVFVIVIRVSIASLPFGGLVGDMHLDRSMRGHVGYEATCSSMSGWIFPGFLTDAAGPSTAEGLVATYPVCGAWQRRRSVLRHCLPSVRCKEAFSRGASATCTWTGPRGCAWATRRCAPLCPTGSSQVSPRALRASALRRAWSPRARFSMPGHVAFQVFFIVIRGPLQRCRTRGSWATCIWTGRCRGTWAARQSATPCPTGSFHVSSRTLRA